MPLIPPVPTLQEQGRCAQPKPSRFRRDVVKHAGKVEKAAAARKQSANERAIWKAIGRAVWTRDGGMCRVCSRHVRREHVYPTMAAQCHHIVYRSAGGSDEFSNLVTLCGQCHADEHEHRISITGSGNGVITVYRRHVETGKILERVERACP